MRSETIFYFVLMVILLGLYVASLGIGGRMVSTDYFGPQGFPQLLIILSLGLLLALTVGNLLKTRKFSSNAPPAAASWKRPFFLSALLLIAYVSLLNTAGYPLATIGFIFGSGKAIGYAHNRKLILFAFVLTGLMVLVFGVLFSVPLPRGVGILRELSFRIY